MATYTYDTFAGTRLKWVFVLPFVYAAATISRAVVQVDDWTSPFARNVLIANVLAPLVIAVVAWLVGFYYIGRRVTADERGLTFKPDPNSLWFWTTVAVPWTAVKELRLTSRRAYDVFGAPSFRLEAAIGARVGGKAETLSLPAKLGLLDAIVDAAGLEPALAGQPARPSGLRLDIAPVIAAKRIGWRWGREG
ncbi:MAG: hypothetical protein ACE5H9_20420 [Anaerolineae bacterium]